MQNNDRSTQSLIVLRVTIACLIAIHGWHRLLTGSVPDLDMGWPFGLFLAWVVTLLEAVAAPLFALGRLVFPLSLVYVFIYTTGLLTYHLGHGWFTSGTDKDGCEYPVLLIVAFLCVAWQHAPFRKGGSINQSERRQHHAA
jgi:putative oxidoreductase